MLRQVLGHSLGNHKTNTILIKPNNIIQHRLQDSDVDRNGIYWICFAAITCTLYSLKMFARPCDGCIHSKPPISSPHILREKSADKEGTKFKRRQKISLHGQRFDLDVTSKALSLTFFFLSLDIFSTKGQPRKGSNFKFRMLEFRRQATTSISKIRTCDYKPEKNQSPLNFCL